MELHSRWNQIAHPIYWHWQEIELPSRAATGVIGRLRVGEESEALDRMPGSLSGIRSRPVDQPGGVQAAPWTGWQINRTK